MIYNPRDLWSIWVLKYHHLLSHSFIHASTTDKVKLDVDALNDFIQNLLMCLLCTINLKPLGVSKQSVASAALLLLGKMISCFVNCGNSETCIYMGKNFTQNFIDFKRLSFMKYSFMTHLTEIVQCWRECMRLSYERLLLTLQNQLQLASIWGPFVLDYLEHHLAVTVNVMNVDVSICDRYCTIKMFL